MFKEGGYLVTKYLFSSLQKGLTYEILSDNIDGYKCTPLVGHLNRSDFLKLAS